MRLFRIHVKNCSGKRLTSRYQGCCLINVWTTLLSCVSNIVGATILFSIVSIILLTEQTETLETGNCYIQLIIVPCSSLLTCDIFQLVDKLLQQCWLRNVVATMARNRKQAAVWPVGSQLLNGKRITRNWMFKQLGKC